MITTNAEISFEYSSQADKFFVKHEKIREKFETNICSLYAGNKNINIKIIKGIKETFYRMKINDYRVIFRVIDKEIIIIDSILAGNRGDIYKKLKNIKG